MAWRFVRYTPFVLAMAACPSGPDQPDGGGKDAMMDVGPPPPGAYCALPGSRIFLGSSTLVLPPPNGVTEADTSFVKLPAGYCVHYYATIPAARAIRFAPGGELFVASPSTSTAGGAPPGMGAVVVVPDDNKDGYGDSTSPFQSGLASTQGMLFANGSYYYQDQTRVMRIPYASGQRTASGTPQQLVDIVAYQSVDHWPKTIDIADDGTLYVTNGGDQNEVCTGMPHAVTGGVFQIDGTPNGKIIAEGFRNSMYMRCQRGHNNCFADELTLDGSGGGGGREKMVLIAPGDWGFPCCASQNLPFNGISPTPNCSTVVPETNSFIVGNTPFGLDFETGKWPAPYTNNTFIAMHGTVGSWSGARIVSIQMDPATGRPLPGGNTGGTDMGSLSDFLTGYDDGSQKHGRPSDVTFAADGRMFIANDFTGVILWVAPTGLMHP